MRILLFSVVFGGFLGCGNIVAEESWGKHVIVSGTTSMPNSALPYDYDGDGNMDVITSFDGEVVVFRGPRWQKHVVYTFVPGKSRTKPRSGCIHSCHLDVDHDGDLDFCGSNNTVFWLECPDDPFGPKPWTYRTIDDQILGTHCLITADVNRDGNLDLIANSGRSLGSTPFPNSLAWIEIPDRPKAKSTSSWDRNIFAKEDAPGGSHYTGFADVDGDGRGDISCAAKGGDRFPGGQWFAWWQQPKDSESVWQKHTLADNQPGATNIHPVDLNGDGKIDFAATRGHGAGVLWFKGPEFRMIDIDEKILAPHCLATVDLDADGDIDLVTCGKEANGIAAWYQNDGKGKFSKHIIGVDQGAYDIRAVDMDADKDLDVLIAGHASKNVVWFENPRRTGDAK